MASAKLSDDLAYLRDIAESGEDAPSLGGRYLVMWGTLMSVTMLVHWCIITDILPVGSRYALLGLWLSASIIGAIASLMIGATMKSRPGSSAAHNKIDRIVWPVAGGSIFAYFAGVTFAVIFRHAPSQLFDTIIPIAFLGYAVAFAGHAAFADAKLKWTQAICAMILVFLTISFVGMSTIYLIAALGIFLLIVVPGILQIRKEPAVIV